MHRPSGALEELADGWNQGINQYSCNVDGGDLFSDSPPTIGRSMYKAELNWGKLVV